MPAVFIICHAPLASALHAVAAHVYPELAGHVAAYDVPPGDDSARYLDEAEQAIAALPSTEVLLLTDAVGATPSNLAGQLARRGTRRVLAGVNLPMLWRALNYRNEPLDELFFRARDGAIGGVQPVITPAPQNQAGKADPHDPKHGHHQQ
jgi:mannose PTS system EIIA component